MKMCNDLNKGHKMMPYLKKIYLYMDNQLLNEYTLYIPWWDLQSKDRHPVPLLHTPREMSIYQSKPGWG